jgi:CRP-like cAMP-binding protein
MFLQSLDYNIQAISDCEISLFPREGLLAMMFERPSIGRALFRDTMIRAAISREWMTNLGRRDSRTKVAHLLCELSLRLKVIGSYHNYGFELPITQEQISDIIGVTPMHVGRVLKALSKEGLVERSNRHIKVVDEDRLKLTGDFNPTYLESVAPDRS